MVKMVWALILALVLMISGLTACGREVVTEDGGNPQGTTETGEMNSGNVRMGLVMTGEEDPLAVAVTVDETGVIQDCVIDQMTEIEDHLLSKNQLGEAYGMKEASPIGKEWNEQAAAFADYVTGMTLEQVQGIPLDKE